MAAFKKMKTWENENQFTDAKIEEIENRNRKTI